MEETFPGEDDEDKQVIKVSSSRTKSAPHTAMTVVAVANRWRRRQHQPDSQNRKKSAKSSTSPTPINKPVAQRKQTSSSGKIGAFLPTVNIGEEFHSPDNWMRYNEIVTKHNGTKSYRRSKCPSPALWGNGRDWRDPPTREGDWVRVYPLGQKALGRETLWNEEPPESHTTMFDKDVKTIISNMTKCSKLAKEIFQKNPTLTDEERNCLLLKSLGLTGLVWLPHTK